MQRYCNFPKVWCVLFLIIATSCEIAQNACERFADIILVELLDIHHRSVILSAEPLAAFALFDTAEIAGVATRVSQARPRLRLGRGDCDGNCCICASGQPEMGASASLLLRHIYDCTSTTCS